LAVTVGDQAVEAADDDFAGAARGAHGNVEAAAR
jgi:hypothetical protein